MMELEEIYDDVQGTTDDNNQASQYVYQDLVPNATPAEYANLSGITSKPGSAKELNRLGYKSLMVFSTDDASKNEYAVANQSGNFSLDMSSNNESSSELVRKRSFKPLPAVPKVYTLQNSKKSVPENEPSSAEEDKELKANQLQKEVPKRDFRIRILCCLVLISIVISLAASAIAVTSIVWSVQQMAQYKDVANCFMELLQNKSFCSDECFKDNATLSEACMRF